jgi:hypothetical protein
MLRLLVTMESSVYRAVTWIPICVSVTWLPKFLTYGRFPWEAPTPGYDLYACLSIAADRPLGSGHRVDANHSTAVSVDPVREAMVPGQCNLCNRITGGLQRWGGISV